MRTVRLEDVCNLTMGQSPKSSSYNTIGEGLPFYQGNADFGEVSPSATTWCTDPKKTAEKGEILISVRAPIGAVNVAGERCCIGRGLAAISPKSDILNPDYIRCVLLAKRSKLELMGTGSTFTAVGKKALGSFEIPLHTSNEQRRIVSQIQLIESLTRQYQRVNKKLDELVKSRFVEMFGDDHCWKRATLQECCSGVDDIRCGPFGSQLHKEDYRDCGIPVWGIPEVGTGFSSLPSKYITEDTARRLSSYSIRRGDVALSRKGNVGQAAWFDGSMPAGVIHSDVLRIRPNPSVLDGRFLVEQLHDSIEVRKQVISASTGAIMAGTNVTKLKKIVIVVPPLSLQQDFAAFVARVDALKAANAQAMTRLQTLYDSLAQDYFGG